MTGPMAPEPITVLIVDDHEMVRIGLRSMLAAPDIVIVGEAADGEEALARIAELRPTVTLMDIRMRDMDGLEVLERLNTQPAQTHVLIITTYRNTAYLLRAMAAGAAGFVLKDISRDQLLATVRAIAAGESRVDQDFLRSVLDRLDDGGSPDRAAGDGPVEPLSPRERDVLQLLVEGMTNQAIAHALGLSSYTVKGYVQNILQKLNAADRTQAAVTAIRLGLVK